MEGVIGIHTKGSQAKEGEQSTIKWRFNSIQQPLNTYRVPGTLLGAQLTKWVCWFLVLKDRIQGAFDEHAQKGILETDTLEGVTYTRDGGASGNTACRREPPGDSLDQKIS